MQNREFENGKAMKENIKDGLAGMVKLLDQIDDDSQIAIRHCKFLYSGMQQLIDRLVYIYGTQELERRFKNED